MRRSIFVFAVTASILAVCPNGAWAATAPEDASTTPVSLRDSIEPFEWGLGWAAVSLIGFAFITWIYPKRAPGDFKSAPGTWSLPDSWITTVTGASAALVALLGANDSLAALFGEEKKQEVAELVIIGVSRPCWSRPAR